MSAAKRRRLDVLLRARDSEWQWHQLGHMQVCTLLQTTTPAPHDSVFTGRMPYLPPNQQRQSTEGNTVTEVTVKVLTTRHRNRTAKTDIRPILYAFCLDTAGVKRVQRVL